MGETMIEFGLRDEADAALAAMVETFLSKGPFKVVTWTTWWGVVPIKAPVRPIKVVEWRTHYACESQEEANAVCALLNYRHYKAQ